MPDLTAKRTLVKSPPELWSELSEVENLARHLGEFGDIRITRVEPETTVAWEGEHASGTVAIEASGWGTKVVLTVALPEAEAPETEVIELPAEPEPEAVAEEQAIVAEPDPVDDSVTDIEARFTAEFGERAGVVQEAHLTERPAKVGFFSRLFGRKPKATPVPAEPVAVEPVVEPEPEPEPVVEPVVEPEPEPVAAEPEPVAAEPEPVEPVATVVEPVATVVEPVATVVMSEPEPEPELIDAERAQAILDSTLDTLGAAHHRPFSRG
jgi:hypothetical protein